jgi:hypothetical protein
LYSLVNLNIYCRDLRDTSAMLFYSVMLAQIPLRENKIYFDQEWFKTKVTQFKKKMYSLIKRVSRKSDTSSTSKCTLSKKGSDTAIQQVTLRIRLSVVIKRLLAISLRKN